MSGGKKFTLSKWFDEWGLAFCGLKNIATKKRFIIPAVIAFVFFGTLLNLLSGGTGSLSLFGASDFGGKCQILFDAFLKLFGVKQTSFLDWAFTFLITILQSILIGLVVFVFKARKDSANLQNAGIVAGLAILGSGCPTCGTTVLMPLLVSIAGSSSMALASTVSWLLTVASVIIALLAFKKVGFEAFAIVEDEKYKKKQEEKQKALEKKKQEKKPKSDKTVTQ